MADFWGCDDICPELDDDKGLSLVLIHSVKGRQIITDLNGGMVCKSVKLKQALPGNTSLVKSCAEPEKRRDFMRQLDELDIPELARKYLARPTVTEIIKRLVPTGIKKHLKLFYHRLAQ